MVEIKKVETRSELKQFVQFYYDLYRGNNCAVPFLYSEEMVTLRSDKNPSFECCEAQYFLAFKEGKVVGRVAAIINRRANERWNCHQVRFGWFDFIDDLEVSTALLKAVEDWGREKGMSEIAGPLGFIDTDREGMLVEGFDQLSTMYINYNYPYYPQHMERMGGFKKDNDYLEMKVKVPEKVPDKFAKLTEMVRKRYGLRVHKFTRHELIEEGYGHRVFHLLNATYKDLYGFSELSEKQVDKLVNDYIKIADLNLVTAIMDGDKMVGFGITFPSFSRAMQKTRDGRFLPFGWWHMLKILKWHKTPIVDLLLIGVLPEYRSKGANALIFDDLIRQFQAYGFEWAETGPQMETNEGVLSQWQYLEATNHRRHRCYRKML
ncbi:MAG: GNAT family N-acetyltransferase [Prevotella sp.]|jgi:GNAT superfamily N-acetyltransferase|nr:GNAT family N-acetyltransferase [Prevotella sp.]MBR0262961.1 GNAT family N-acetyltransferase [Prevotella sp.]